MLTLTEEEEQVIAKSGSELYRELLRLYSEAEVDDYHSAGTWKDEQMRMDIQLFWQHRREAGAPPPKPLEEVTIPDVTSTKPALAVVKAPVTLGGVTPPKLAVTGGSNGATPLEDLKEIAQFVAKHKADPMKAKAILQKLGRERRKYIMTNFTPKGGNVSEELETYIAECESTKAWGDAPATDAGTAAAGAAKTVITVNGGAKAPLTVTPVRPAAAGGIRPAAATPQLAVKRPIAAVGGPQVVPANKRPALVLGNPAAARPTLAAVRPVAVRPAAAPAAARPAVVAARRPPVLVVKK